MSEAKITITIDAFKNMPDAQRLMRRAKREMQRNGTWGKGRAPSPYCRTMLLRVDGEPVSVLCFAPISKSLALKSKIEDIDKLAGTILIMGAYTVRNWRRKGGHRVLWNHLVKMHKDDPDFVVIRSGAHKKNAASIAMQRQQGRDFFERGPTHLRSRYWLRPTRTQNIIRKLNEIRAKTIGLPFREKTEYSEE
jgi:hypothetical protein